MLLLNVSDNGHGIIKEDLVNVFKPFFRGQNSKSKMKVGTGLGLTLVKELVHMHGGTVNVSSIYGKGTSVSVSIPAV